MTSEEQTKQEGLECLDDDVLAHIVEQSLSEYGELKGEATVAFAELERRTPERS